MKKAIFVRSLFAVALIACCPLQTRADTIALSFTGGSVNNASTATVGSAFTISSSPVLVTQLGLWDFGNDGLNESHSVSIWTSTGTLVAQTTIPAGTGGTLKDGFRYVSITSVLLAAGSYTIGGFYATGVDNLVLSASSITTASGVTYVGPRSGTGPGFPSGNPFSFSSYFGPNFQFTTAVGTPDSGSTWALLLLGVTAAFGLNLLLHRRSKA